MSFRLLVEGSDDFHLVKNVLRAHGVTLDQREIHNCGGLEILLDQSLPQHLRASYDAIGVIVDADLDIESRWQSVSARLKEAGYEVPETPPSDGLIVTTHPPVVGVWLMPNNSLPGTLEDFVERLIDPADALWPYAKACVASIPMPRRFREAAERKAEIHTFLAWQEEPGTPLGLAVTKKYFQTDVALVHSFLAWVNRLRTSK